MQSLDQPWQQVASLPYWLHASGQPVATVIRTVAAKRRALQARQRKRVRRLFVVQNNGLVRLEQSFMVRFWSTVKLASEV